MKAPLNAYLEKILDAFPDGLWLSDAHSTCLFVNKKYEELSGVSREWMVGRKATDIVREGFFDVAVNPEVIATGQPVSKVQVLSNGRHLALDGVPITDDEGRTVMCITFIHDISTIARMEGKLSRQRDLLEKLIGIQARAELNGEEDGSSFMASPAMQSFLQLSRILARTDLPILILGEPGIGKDITAQRVHSYSGRAGKPFIKVECGLAPSTEQDAETETRPAALSGGRESRLEAELFGPAKADRPGGDGNASLSLIEAAEGGTLFLQEIGQLSLPAQDRLLRFLEEGTVLRAGSSTPRKADVRIIASSNENLERAVKQGGFRSKLYYRLNTAVLNIPPLRMRREDIIPLAKYFISYFAMLYSRPVELADDACGALMAYAWPGNVRELKGLMQRAVMTTTTPFIHAGDLPLGQTPAADTAAPKPWMENFSFDGKDYRDIMLEFEGQMLKAAIEKSDGNMAAASRMLKMDRSTMFRKIRNLEQHGIHIL
ncbi:MAG: sigma 54-interacting transcriptional regulator [Desulfovibrionaceae bacterium]|nr:sigma 54-interacting transcriptional regulator [Desulfovibrionaceae bacterium]